MDISTLYESRIPTVPATATLAMAARVMGREGVVAVGLAEEGQIVGLLTQDDLGVAAAAGTDPIEALAIDWIPTTLIGATPDESPSSVTRRMRALRLHHLQVIDGGRIIGVVSLDDLDHGRVLFGEETGRLARGVARAPEALVRVSMYDEKAHAI
ncbi:MAG: CBS domain-containing protein [Actinomycetota bacterium]